MGHYCQDTANSSLGHTASATYDNMNRLATSVATGSSTHNLTFSYDRFGNMTCVVNGQTNGPCPSYAFSSTSNRMTNSNYTYDSSGDLTQNGTGTGTHTYQWDAENRTTSVDGSSCSTSTACYVYNALDQRVEKQTGTSYLEYLYNPSGIEVEANPRQTWFNWHYLFLGGRRFGKYANNVTYFIHQDNLGTTTTGTDYTGTLVWDMLSYPWGQNWNSAGTVNDLRFASLHTRDSESNLDPTHFRLFSSDQGRWFSPDPRHGGARNPQMLNRYAYVTGNPNSRIDPKGLCGCYAGYGYETGYYSGGCGGCSAGYCNTSTDPPTNPTPGTIHVRSTAPPPPPPVTTTLDKCALGVIICTAAAYKCYVGVLNLYQPCVFDCTDSLVNQGVPADYALDICVGICDSFVSALLYGCYQAQLGCLKQYCG